MEQFLEMLKKIKVIVSEVEGTITEGLISYDELGNTPFKYFCIKDFEAINEIKKEFIFVFLSTDNSISYHLCRRKNIPFYWAPKDKKRELLKILQRYEVSPEEVLYIGYSYSDIECMQMIPLSICPEDAVSSIKNIAYRMFYSISGTGVLSELYEILKPEILRRKQCL